jgi:hypothetical protein
MLVKSDTIVFNDDFTIGNVLIECCVFRQLFHRLGGVLDQFG